MRISGVALQSDFDGKLPRFERLDLPFVVRLANHLQRDLIHVEINLDRIERYDGGQLRLILVDQIAGRQKVAANLAIDRRKNPAKAEIELEHLKARLGGLQRMLRLLPPRLDSDRGLAG